MGKRAAGQPPEAYIASTQRIRKFGNEFFRNLNLGKNLKKGFLSRSPSSPEVLPLPNPQQRVRSWRRHYLRDWLHSCQLAAIFSLPIRERFYYVAI